MMSIVNEKQDAIRALCQRYHVQRLEVFGSVTREAFDPARSDIDFLVEFECNSPAVHYECYFGLLEGLEKLFGRHIVWSNIGYYGTRISGKRWTRRGKRSMQRNPRKYLFDMLDL